MKHIAVLFMMSCVVMMWSTELSAHPSPTSEVFLDFTVDGVHVEHKAPLSELEVALGQRIYDPDVSAKESASRHGDLLREYAIKSVKVQGTSGSDAWSLDSITVSGEERGDDKMMIFSMDFTMPDTQESRDHSVILHDAIVSGKVMSHYTRVYVRSDWYAGQVHADHVRSVGILHGGKSAVMIAREGQWWEGFKGTVVMGMEHIAHGADHMLFLLALLLVAPVVVRKNRWCGDHDVWRGLRMLGKLVTAFTVGHSLSLVLGSMYVEEIPSMWVEMCVALSVIIASVHVIRPVFPRREALLAMIFGLIHGLAFASELPLHSVGMTQKIWTVFSFNLGVELQQLLIIALVVPWLFIMAQGLIYQWFRWCVSGVAIVLSCGWLFDTLTERGNPFEPVIQWGLSHQILLLAGCILIAFLSRVIQFQVTSQSSALVEG